MAALLRPLARDSGVPALTFERRLTRTDRQSRVVGLAVPWRIRLPLELAMRIF